MKHFDFVSYLIMRLEFWHHFSFRQNLSFIFRASSIIKLTLRFLLGLSFFCMFGCSFFSPQPKLTNIVEVTNTDPIVEMHIEWLDSNNLTNIHRIEALALLAEPNDVHEIWGRAILLTAKDASIEELKEGETLLVGLSAKSVDARIQKLLSYVLNQNKRYQNLKNNLHTIRSLETQIAAYKRQLKKQKKENRILKNKIEALTDIEHQINLRNNKKEL